MKEFNFEELKKEIRFELVYPRGLISTRQDAAGILNVDISEIDKLMKNRKLDELKSPCAVFFYNSDLVSIREGTPVPSIYNPCYDDIEKHIGFVLRYPEKLLLTRKTAPAYLKVSWYAFDKLRKTGEFKEYDYQGVKFFNREELAKWDQEKRAVK